MHNCRASVDPTNMINKHKGVLQAGQAVFPCKLRQLHAQILEIYLGFHDMVPETQLEWLANTPVLDRLLGQLHPTASSDAQRNASNILSQAAQSSRVPLARQFASGDNLSRVFDLAFSPDVSIEVRPTLPCTIFYDRTFSA